jgi:hypothetical protein
MATTFATFAPGVNTGVPLTEPHAPNGPHGLDVTGGT